MTESREHPEFEALSNLLDGGLSGEEAAKIAEHMSVCDSCAATYTSLAGLVSSARDLPKSVVPPADLWIDLRKSLDHRKEIVLPTHNTMDSDVLRSTHARFSGRTAALLVVAAVLLIALSSGITAIVLRQEKGRLAVGDSIPSSVDPATAGTRAVLPAGFRHTETEFNRTIGELQLAVDTQRDQLSPETIRTVDRSLAVVDSAIAEARAALLADPNNQMLIDLLSANYQRKLDLLRRTSELGSRT